MLEVDRVGAVRDEVGVKRAGDERLLNSVADDYEGNEQMKAPVVRREVLNAVVELQTRRYKKDRREDEEDENAHLCVGLLSMLG